MMKRIYIAGPYTAKTREEIEQNIDRARAAGIMFARAGFAPLIPHCNTAGWERLTDMAYDTFLEIDLAWIGATDAIYFQGNYQNSYGCSVEMQTAAAMGIPVFYEGVHTPDDVRAYFDATKNMEVKQG